MNINNNITKGYSREEREAQIAAVQRLSRKKRESNLHRPKSLIDALARQEPPSAAKIKALAEIEYSSPVTSLYLRMDPEKAAPREKALVRFFHSLKTRALEEQRDFIAALPKLQREILNDDSKEIEVLLAEHFVTTGPRSLIIFKSGEQLNRVFRLPARTIDALVIAGDPHVTPLEAVLEENERCCSWRSPSAKAVCWSIISGIWRLTGSRPLCRRRQCSRHSSETKGAI